MLTAYQIAFDLYESATQQFLSRVQECFKGVLPALPESPPSTEGMYIICYWEWDSLFSDNGFEFKKTFFNFFQYSKNV